MIIFSKDKIKTHSYICSSRYILGILLASSVSRGQCLMLENGNFLLFLRVIMRCGKCDTEFDSNSSAYCPRCGAPVRPMLPPLPRRYGTGGCLWGCLISAAVVFVLAVLAPILLMLAGSWLLGSSQVSGWVEKSAEQLMEMVQESEMANEYTYNMVGTLGEGTPIVVQLDEPEPGMLAGQLLVDDATLGITGSITSDGDVELTVVSPEGGEDRLWKGVAVLNPDGIAAIQGEVSGSGEKFYISRR